MGSDYHLYQVLGDTGIGLGDDHGWRIVEARGSAFPLVTGQFKAK